MSQRLYIFSVCGARYVGFAVKDAVIVQALLVVADVATCLFAALICRHKIKKTRLLGELFVYYCGYSLMTHYTVTKG